MKLVKKEIKFTTRGNADIVEITGKVSDLVRESGFSEGIICLFVPGATAGITTIELEQGLVKDFREMIARLIPANAGYSHNVSHMDGNAHSHLAASLIGPSLTIPFEKGGPVLGAWQQIIVVDFDNRPRDRKIIVKIIGE